MILINIYNNNNNNGRLFFPRKLFANVKHYLEQIIWESRSELPEQFYVDTAKTEAAPPPPKQL